MFLVLRAFAPGCTALTGVEAISNGVPAFRTPKSAQRRDARWPSMGAIAITMFAGITALALIAHGARRRGPLRPDRLRRHCGTDPQRTVIAQLAAAVFGGATGSASTTSRPPPR